MPAVKSSLVHPAYKTEYRVRNWREYEQGLRSRGDVTIWFSEEATASWISRSTGARGGPRLYSDLAIETSLTLRTVFGLPLRQTEGFVGALLRMLRLDHLPVPDHSTLSRRAQSLALALKAPQCRGPIHLIVDSSGLGIVGEGVGGSQARNPRHAGLAEAARRSRWSWLHRRTLFDREPSR